MQRSKPTALGTEFIESHTHLMDGVFAFVEQPSLNDPRKKEEPGNTQVQINASELFSLLKAQS